VKNLVKYLLALTVLGSFLAYLFIGKSQAQFSIAPTTDTTKPYMFKSEEAVAPVYTLQTPVELDEYVIYELVNKERSNHKLKELRLDPALCEYTEFRLSQIKVNFSHNGFKQTSLQYVQENNLKQVGENLVKDYASESATVHDWMNSPTHRENILDATYKDTCVRCDGQYCVQIFATK
jgi:uncharacterized protein YkwD